MDFKQGSITTIHNLQVDDKFLHAEVCELSRDKKCALVIPMHYRELGTPALKGIVKKLGKNSFLNEIIIALTARNKKEYEKVSKFFKPLGKKCRVLWCEAPKVIKTIDSLKSAGIEIRAHGGKGRAIWLAFGIASLNNYAVALHDADIENYSEKILPRLLYPILEPSLDYSFSKGYYARVSDNKMWGRVARLFFSPFVKALQYKTKFRSKFLRYLEDYRYPLSGEMAMTTDLSLNLRIPDDWGLEVGILAEIYRNIALKRVCQIDLDFYSHKHQDLGDKSDGLSKMASEIVKTSFRTLSELEGTDISSSMQLSLRVLYRRLAQDSIRKYYSDCKMNGLSYNRHDEELAVEEFAKAISSAATSYLNNPTSHQYPDWVRVMEAVPALPKELKKSAKRWKVQSELRNIILSEAEDLF
ncbi:MAG: glucosyl-3-phosphoglycerate synthase [Candidatus Micrarchaeia archaeon]